MNVIRTIAAGLLSGMIILSLTACSCGKDEPNVLAERAGTYEVTAMITDGKETPAEDLTLLKSKGLDCILTLADDGTGTVDLFGEKNDLIWDEESISAGGKIMSYTYEDRQIVLVNGNSTLTFTLKDENP